MRQKHQLKVYQLKRIQSQIDSIQKSTKPSKEKKIPILLKLFCKTDTEEMFPNSLYEASITIRKPDKEPLKKEKNTGQYLW